jgi:type I restriction enzyme M protein
VLANGSMSSQQSARARSAEKLVEADLVDCMVACPGQLFYATQIPVCLWFLARDKGNGKFRTARARCCSSTPASWARMDARAPRAARRGHREASPAPTTPGANEGGKYADVAGFCKAATLAEIQSHDFVLTPGRYVGAEEVEDDGEPFEEKMERRLLQWPRRSGAAGGCAP